MYNLVISEPFSVKLGLGYLRSYSKLFVSSDFYLDVQCENGIQIKVSASKGRFKYCKIYKRTASRYAALCRLAEEKNRGGLLYHHLA